MVWTSIEAYIIDSFTWRTKYIIGYIERLSLIVQLVDVTSLWHHKWPQVSQSQRRPDGISLISHIMTLSEPSFKSRVTSHIIWNSPQYARYIYHNDVTVTNFLFHVTALRIARIEFGKQCFHILVIHVTALAIWNIINEMYFRLNCWKFKYCTNY